MAADPPGGQKTQKGRPQRKGDPPAHDVVQAPEQRLDIGSAANGPAPGSPFQGKPAQKKPVPIFFPPGKSPPVRVRCHSGQDRVSLVERSAPETRIRMDQDAATLVEDEGLSAKPGSPRIFSNQILKTDIQADGADRAARIRVDPGQAAEVLDGAAGEGGGNPLPDCVEFAEFLLRDPAKRELLLICTVGLHAVTAEPGQEGRQRLSRPVIEDHAQKPRGIPVCKALEIRARIPDEHIQDPFWFPARGEFQGKLGENRGQGVGFHLSGFQAPPENLRELPKVVKSGVPDVTPDEISERESPSQDHDQGWNQASPQQKDVQAGAKAPLHGLLSQRIHPRDGSMKGLMPNFQPSRALRATSSSRSCRSHKAGISS